MRIRIVADVLMPEYDGNKITAEFVREYIAGCENVIVPGVTSWDNVVTGDLPDGRITVTADLVTGGTTGPDYGNEEVTPEFVRTYVEGAEAYWLIPGVLFVDEFSELATA